MEMTFRQGGWFCSSKMTAMYLTGRKEKPNHFTGQAFRCLFGVITALLLLYLVTDTVFGVM